MRIYELISEQTIGTTGSTTGSTTGAPGQVGTVSQTPATATTSTSATTKPAATTDPNMIQLGKILGQAGIKDPAAAGDAASALQTIQQDPTPTLTDRQKAVLGPITATLMKSPATATAIKAIAKQRPATPMGSTPPPTIK